MCQPEAGRDCTLVAEAVEVAELQAAGVGNAAEEAVAAAAASVGFHSHSSRKAQTAPGAA